jgi:hypothetical protein
MSIAPAIRDNNGSNPCLPPHILGRLLDKLRERIAAEQQDDMAGIRAMREAVMAKRQASVVALNEFGMQFVNK